MFIEITKNGIKNYYRNKDFTVKRTKYGISFYKNGHITHVFNGKIFPVNNKNTPQNDTVRFIL